jgi:glyoxylase-like metal-dependent hydrolase (beta-lactamase superfamily II)
MTRKIGDAVVTRIEESIGPLFDPGFFFPDWREDVLREHGHWLVPTHLAPDSGKLILSIHSWLIRTRHHTILLDTCAGNDKHRPAIPHFHMRKTPYLARLAAAGVATEAVDFVLCTHLHSDHVGWNTRLVDGRWVPTFPNAKYVFSKNERDYWDPARGLLGGTDGAAHAKSRFAGVFEDSVLPVIAAGQEMIVEGEYRLGDELSIEPAPGHTPGHVVVKLRSRDEEGVFTGDVLHHPIQIHHPEWNSVVCVLPEAARHTRRRILEHCAAEGSLMLPAHFAAPHAARIRRRGERFEFTLE